MMEHFFRKPQMVLCSGLDDLKANAKKLSDESIENLRRFPSFRKFVEQSKIDERKLLLLDDKYTKKFTIQKLGELHKHVSDFHIILKCLNVLVRDLPGSPLGRNVREIFLKSNKLFSIQVREIYCRAVSTNIMEEKDYKHALALLGVQSKVELSSKISSVLSILRLDSIVGILSNVDENRFVSTINKLEHLLKNLDQNNLIQVLSSELLEPFLAPPTSFPMHELVYFDNLASIRRRISGAPRSAIHNALNNPHSYLEVSL